MKWNINHNKDNTFHEGCLSKATTKNWVASKKRKIFLSIIWTKTYNLVTEDFIRTYPLFCSYCFGHMQKEFEIDNDQNFLNQIVTMDEAWVYFYDSKMKQQSMQ